MQGLLIDNKLWENLSSPPQTETPIWLKLNNGNIVLSVHVHTEQATGYVAATLSKHGDVMYDESTMYITRDALWQPFNLLYYEEESSQEEAPVTSGKQEAQLD